MKTTEVKNLYCNKDELNTWKLYLMSLHYEIEIHELGAREFVIKYWKK